MRLSVCMLTAEPAARVRAALSSLREVADEIVVAADARVDGATLRAYADLADKLLRIEFHVLERHLAWLHAQCGGDWILRLDGDEIPSRALVERLPQLIASESIDQYRIAQAWLYPDGRHVVDEFPWAGDFPNRLVRAGGSLRFGGWLHQHAAPSGQTAYVEEPTYHLALLEPVEQRRAKAIRYEVSQPSMRAAGRRFNEAWYLPEDRGPLDLRAVPADDLASIASALAPASERAGDPPPDVPVTPLAEADAAWEGRSVGPGAYRATIRARRPGPARLIAGERHRLLFEVTNEGDARWPWGLDQRPAIRLSYHWLSEGVMEDHEGLRTAFPAYVAPGETVLAALDVQAPATPGDRILEVDVVHEDVRWFRCPCRVAVEVRDAGDAAATSGPLACSPRPRAQRVRRRRIPRVVHRVWLGDRPMPDRDRAYGDALAAIHPGWEHRLWRDADLPALGIGARERSRARTMSELSNVVRYEILSRHGGVYMDTDVECRRSFAPLLRGVSAFAALELPGRIGNAVLGAVPGHPAFERAAREARETLGLGHHSVDANGPYFLTLILEQVRDVHILPAIAFYPYLWNEPERAGEDFPGAYAVHHWAKSWAA